MARLEGLLEEIRDLVKRQLEDDIAWKMREVDRHQVMMEAWARLLSRHGEPLRGPEN